MDTLHLMVCPHDTANNPDRWYRFTQYLSRHLGTPIHFDVALDFADFHTNLNQADIVYANPSDTLLLIEQHNFVPLVRPANLYDEVVFVANNDVANPTLESLHNAPVASVTSMLATRIGLRFLKNHGIEPAEILDHDSWLSVIGSLWRQETSYGIVYKDTYDELSEQGKGMVNAFASSNEGVAFHSIVIGRNAQTREDDLRRMFLSMGNDEQGKELLHDLRITEWISSTQAEIQTIKQILST
jgi:ABC-type phosphate/phosphonate transport system substrate-binding protein